MRFSPLSHHRVRLVSLLAAVSSQGALRYQALRLVGRCCFDQAALGAISGVAPRMLAVEVVPGSSSGSSGLYNRLLYICICTYMICSLSLSPLSLYLSIVYSLSLMWGGLLWPVCFCIRYTIQSIDFP